MTAVEVMDGPERRELSGESVSMFELRVPADWDSPYAELFRQAALLCDELGPLSVALLGPYWRESDDQFVLTVYLSSVGSCV